MCKYNISSSTTAPYHPQYKSAERRIQVYKKGTNNILDQTVATNYLLMYDLLLWVVMYNCLDKPSHGHRSAHATAFGTTPEIIQFMYYIFWDPVYYCDTEGKFPSTKEQLGHLLGPTQQCGDELT